MSDVKTHLIRAEDLRVIVQKVGLDRLMDETISSIASIAQANTGSSFDIPERAGFHYKDPNLGLIEWMPAMQHGNHVVLKLVGYHPNNPSTRQLPTILSTLLVLDTATGHLSSVVDGTFATALRTGAASAVATSVLQSPGASNLGLVGAGAQAVTQLHGLSRVMDLATVYVFDVDESTANSFQDRVAGLSLREVEIKRASLAEVVTNSDVLTTATSVNPGDGPVIKDMNLREHVHVNAVGADFPGKFELPLSLLKRSLVVPDFVPQAMKEGECQRLNPGHLGPDFCTLLSNPEGYSNYRNQATIFDSTGFALEDYAVAMLISRYAREVNCGVSIELESIGWDAKNPYGFLRHPEQNNQTMGKA